MHEKFKFFLQKSKQSMSSPPSRTRGVGHSMSSINVQLTLPDWSQTKRFNLVLLPTSRTNILLRERSDAKVTNTPTPPRQIPTQRGIGNIIVIMKMTLKSGGP